MIPFNELKGLQIPLLNSIVNWRNDERFYYSTPLLKREHPSFTNCGIVLQSLNEIGATAHAQTLSDDLLNFLESNNLEVFPNEAGGPPHIVNNSWAFLGILNCYPSKFEDERIVKAINWFITNNNEDGSWDLYPRTTAANRAFSTAYSLRLLIEYYEIIKTSNKKNETLEGVIRKGFAYLLNNRSRQFKNEPLYLWTGSDRKQNLANNQINFTITAICWHIFYKASKILDEDLWRTNVIDTILDVVKHFNENTKKFESEGLDIDIWGTVQENSPNYSYIFFAPVNVTTLLSFLDVPEVVEEKKYYDFISYLLRWISDNQSTVQNNIGIRGSEFHRPVTIWSTAQALIVLGKVSRHAYELRMIEEKHLAEPQLVSDNYLDERLQAWNSYLIDEARKSSDKRFGYFRTGLGLFLLLFVIFIGIPIVNNYSTWDGRIWLATLIYGIFTTFFGATLIKASKMKIKDSLFNFIVSRKKKLFQPVIEHFTQK